VRSFETVRGPLPRLRLRETGPGRALAWPDLDEIRSAPEGWLRAILRLLLRRKFADFSRYRCASLLRAVASRMNWLEIRDPRAYVRHLRGSPAELERLYERLLIKTTAFFRDPEAFESLKRLVLRPLVRRGAGVPIRVWVAGCSTGEEAYSVAMGLYECCEVYRKTPPIQILATDLSDLALRQARAGEYTDRRVSGLSADRLSRFFTKTASGYRVAWSIRRLCVFSRHNLAQNVPFCRMDLVTCRNVLIYMEPDLQQQVLAKLHFALRPGGALMLGSTEAIPGSADWKVWDAKSRIYRRI
jgi:two-component system CheB/CheR fusion protein